MTLEVVTLKFPDSNLDLMESDTSMMAICALMEATYSKGSLCLSNLAKEGGLNPSGTDSPLV